VIERLSIDRFKSVRSVSILCRKVNLFIGAPDTGKTNILEALQFLSHLGWGLPLDESLRLDQALGFEPLFYRQFFDRPFRIGMLIGSGELAVEARPAGGSRALRIVSGGAHDVQFGSALRAFVDIVRFYSYATSRHWAYTSDTLRGTELVMPPSGANLLYIARHHSRVYEFLKETVGPLGWKLRFDQNPGTFRLSDVRGEEIVDYNLDLLSDSLKRLFFYGAILLTSKEAVLVFDEPDVMAFPPYPKILGEMIAADTDNQFFLTTHNPYFLSALVEKTPAEKLALFVCHRDPEGATEVRQLGPDEIQRVIEHGASVFFNLDEFLGS